MAVDKGTLLIVDDEAEIREIIEINVSAMGFTVLEAGDGEQALEILKTHKVDVVVSDLMMPRMSGISLLTDMREIGFIQPFIFVTAYPSQDSTIQALRLGAFDYVEKPFDSDELKSLILEAVRVSQEMNRLGIKAAPTRQAMIETENQTVSDIQKLKTLRYNETGVTRAPAGQSRNRLLEMFVSEAMPQLLFCDAAINGLENAEERSFELGYLFRVMQAIATAGSSISAKSVVEFASEAERLYTALRVRPRAVNDESIGLALRVNETLKGLVNIVSGHATEMTPEHKELLRELRSAADNLDGTAKAS